MEESIRKHIKHLTYPKGKSFFIHTIYISGQEEGADFMSVDGIESYFEKILQTVLMKVGR